MEYGIVLGFFKQQIIPTSGKRGKKIIAKRGIEKVGNFF